MKLKKLKQQLIDNRTASLRVRDFDNVPDFVRWALQANNLDYEAIQQQMAAVNEFVEKPDAHIVQDVYKTLFVDKMKVDSLQLIPHYFAVKYVRNRTNNFEQINLQENAAQCEISVTEDIPRSTMILTWKESLMIDGGKKENLTMLNFSDHCLTLENNCNVRFAEDFNPEHLCFNNNVKDHVYHSFTFDAENQISQYYCYHCDSKMTNWVRPPKTQTVNYQNETDMTK
ncbi:MAG: hypothetical protein NC133_02085 [Prevotella sp.]|nr:hypothetical protein [Prevotella sp.]